MTNVSLRVTETAGRGSLVAGFTGGGSLAGSPAGAGSLACSMQGSLEVRPVGFGSPVGTIGALAGMSSGDCGRARASPVDPLAGTGPPLAAVQRSVPAPDPIGWEFVR